MPFIHTRRAFLASAAALFTSAAGISGLADKTFAQESKEPVTLVLANSQWVDALRGKNLWNAMLKYQEVAPHVTLEQEAIPSAEIANKLTTEMAAGQGPDIAMMQEHLFYTAADAGFLVDIGKAVEGNGKLNATNEGGVVDGKRLGVAWQRAVYALIYNKPLVDKSGAKVPTNVDELIEAAKAVHDATGAIGFISRHQIADFTGFFMDFQSWAYGYGVNWVDANGKITINTPEAVAAVAAFKKMYDDNIIPVGDDFPTQRTRFKENQVGFAIDNSGGTLNIASGGALKPGDLHSAPLPFAQPGAHQQIFVVVSKHSKHKQAAIDFVAWLAGPDGQAALREASGPDTLATDVPVTEAFRNANPWADTFAKLAVNSRSTLIPGYEVETPQIMRIVMQALEKVIIAGEDPATALADAQQEVDAKSF